MEADASFLPLLEFQLRGEYDGADKKNNGNYYNFEFDTDNRFFGFTEQAPDDFGSYSITSDGKKYCLNIEYSSGTDTYEIDFSDDGAVTLDNDWHKFTLTKR